MQLVGKSTDIYYQRCTSEITSALRNKFNLDSQETIGQKFTHLIELHTVPHTHLRQRVTPGEFQIQ